MIQVHITSDKRAEGKTVLAWGIMCYLRSLGHNVEFDGGYAEKRSIECDDIFPNNFTSRDIVVSTENVEIKNT